ncbi:MULTISPECIES: pirin family protein [Thalassolituus]|uniref:pirin family protein n=1 Tax=Thalassolituus TaxID=187492 RepID=UPI001E4A44D0|nr:MULTISPECIES: pirin family protein [Thalassolituus]MCB2385047.1 pirin family protein [Thalassolituus alkanivorans]MCB2423328.1 pirin family protein [Thalassolituus alkanivorans]
MNERQLQHIIPSHPTSDGDGVKIRRVALFDQPVADPFLMLDELSSDNPDDFIGGFPPHPHRGMETLTYLRHGSLEHRDHMGNRGMINSGGAQWMSAGRGVIHSEMPAREMQQLHGFQLWINIPAKDKMQAPKYRDVSVAEIPLITQSNGMQVRVIAGQWQIEGNNIQGPLTDLAAHAGYLDIELPAGSSLSLPTPAEQNVVAFVYQGQLQTQPLAPEKSLLVFGKGEQLILNAQSDTKLLLLSGNTIGEKIVHYGPFVMNSIEEIEQAIQDYNAGRFGRD